MSIMKMTRNQIGLECKSKHLPALLACFVSLVFSTSVVHAQNPPIVNPSPVQPQGGQNGSVNGLAGTLVDPSVDYRLSAGDTIDIQIEDAQELNGQWRIAPNGSFEMPVLGVVQAQGKTAIELSRHLADLLKQQDYLKKPQVKVAIRQYSNQYFFIQGAVRVPGVYPLEGKPSLVKLIGLAGGLAENYGPTAYIIRPKKQKSSDSPTASLVDADSGNGTVQRAASNSDTESEDDYDFIKINLTPIFQFGKFDQNIRLEPGDVVNIPPARMFFVAGEVRAPGSFQIKEGTTLRQAIALAQGLTPNAASSRGVIFRDDPETGKRQELAVDVRQVMNGKMEDIVLLPNDIVIVPNSRSKTFGNALLNAFGMNSMRVPMLRY